MAAVIFHVDSEAEIGHIRIANEEVAEVAAEHNDVLIPFASIDPAKGKMGAREARRLIDDYGVRGFKFHPSTAGLLPERSARPTCCTRRSRKRSCPRCSTRGQTGVGARVRGGMGVRLKYSNPMYLDDVAVDFPDMPIILAHPSFPWQDEALAVATHKPNVYIDLSGWSPKYFPPNLVQYANTLLKERVLFGSDYPGAHAGPLDRGLRDAAIKPEVRPLIMKENAVRLLGLQSNVTMDAPCPARCGHRDLASRPAGGAAADDAARAEAAAGRSAHPRGRGRREPPGCAAAHGLLSAAAGHHRYSRARSGRRDRAGRAGRRLARTSASRCARSSRAAVTRSTPRRRLVQCLPIPASLTVEEAAALPETFFTVYLNVIERGELRAGARNAT